ncbi:MAG: cobaltochelatase subunit CobN [bacterium]
MIKTIDRICMFCIILCSVFCPLSSGQAQPLTISLMPGDTHSKLALDTVKSIQKEYPHLSGKVAFKVYTSYSIKNRLKTAEEIADSKVVFLLRIMDRQVVELAKPYIKQVVKNGGKVYGFGGIYSKEHQDMGIIDDEQINAYYKENGFENIRNMLLFVLSRDFGLKLPWKEPSPIPQSGIYLRKERRVVANLNEFLKSYQPNGDKWVGVLFYKSNFDSGNLLTVDSVIESLEQEGFSVLPVYGYPPEIPIERFFFDEEGKSRIHCLVAHSMKLGIKPEVVIPLLTRLNVPVINAIPLYTQSKEEWEASAVGLNIFERSWQIAGPEMAGISQPTVIASRERMVENGIEYIEERPIPERVERLIDRVKGWINLQDKPNRDKRIAIIYYNYPPGKQNVGASYLNVLPESLWEILQRMKIEGYDFGTGEIKKEMLFNDILTYGRNIGNWAPGELDRLVRTGKPVLIPMNLYKQWFEELPQGMATAMLRDWGRPEDSKIMTWTDDRGKKYIVIPAVKYGNILFMPQPSRGWEQDVKKLYHSVTLSPHHQYVAFYLWLKKVFSADAVAHIGKHSTHEWLSGKEVGFTENDPPEALIQHLPNIYPYIVDDVGEGLQAKRRGMAVIIDHLTPPFDKARLNKELRELTGLINDYNVAREKSLSLAETKLAEINNLARRIGLLTDLKIAEVKTEEDVEEVEHYLQDIGEKQTPFGMHTFGRAPEERYIRTTAEAILGTESSAQRLADYEQRIIQSAQRELDSFIAALSGRYIPAGQGNDPIRNPDSLPTGKNFYSFDPRRIPSKTTYEMGVKLAKELIDGYKNRHGKYPDKLTFNLWGIETIRHEGVMESQIMYLMGIKPKWNERKEVVGVEPIPAYELGRARIDVTIVPSGLYRDLFSNLMDLLDKAVSLAKQQDETDNIIRLNILKAKKILMEKGISEDMAERLASVRLFTVPSGAYGTNLSNLIPLSNTWDNEKQVADVYLMRMSHLYGQGFWGTKIEQGNRPEELDEDISLLLFKNALSGTKVAVHSISGNVYATLDNDDFFQYLGGTAMAIRSIDGKTPEVYVTNMSNPRQPKQETLEKFMGREMRARYLNPEWIKAMMNEGYAGSRFIDKVVEYLWGWQVTVPEAIDAAKWNEMYETYILDRNELGIKDMFRSSKNMWAYQSVVARMLECVRKKYWKPEKEIIETLALEYARSVQEVGLACCDHTCNNPLLTQFTRQVLMSVPGSKVQMQGFMKAQSQMSEGRRQRAEGRRQKAEDRSQRSETKQKTIAPGDKAKKIAPLAQVEGYEMEEVKTADGISSAPIPYLFIAGFLIFIGLIALGFRRKI